MTNSQIIEALEKAEELLTAALDQVGDALTAIREDRRDERVAPDAAPDVALEARRSQSLTRIIDIAHEWGWDGVNNSKILEDFLEGCFNDLNVRLGGAEKGCREATQALEAIISRVALVSPYYEMARAALERCSGHH